MDFNDFYGKKQYIKFSEYLDILKSLTKNQLREVIAFARIELKRRPGNEED
jgi:hypothetical protein